ncbi:hypothetical protein HY496_03690, partial [Candidatus Woesearchaeota archaeon]|nr:hypothetical protein [Candidatus Woesearchaeota archaeon]
RVLVAEGTFIAVLSSFPLNEWQRQKEVNAFDSQHWTEIMRDIGFIVDVKTQDSCVFFACRKSNIY